MRSWVHLRILARRRATPFGPLRVAPAFSGSSAASASGASSARGFSSAGRNVFNSLGLRPPLSAGALPAGVLRRSVSAGSWRTHFWLEARRCLAAIGSTASYYKLLGVKEGSSQAEIKRAYLREAKKYHPDLNPSPDATLRFQELARAYDVLSNATKRAAYDSHGGGSGGHAPDPSMRDIDAAELFRSVLEEMGLEDFRVYLQTVKQDAEAAGAAARRGEFRPAGDFVVAHKALSACVILPLAVVLRYPGAVAVALRVVAALPTLLLAALAREPRLFVGIGRLMSLKWQVVARRAAARTREKRREG